MAISNKKTNEHLNKIYYWLFINKLTLNLNKTVYITFGNYYDSVPKITCIKINDITISRVSNCKYLGIILDQRMKWQEHIKSLVNKTKYLIFIFAKLTELLSYKSLNSLVTYRILAWGSAYDTTIKKIENVQAKILKIISKNHNNLPLNIVQNYVLNFILQNYNVLFPNNEESNDNDNSNLFYNIF